MLKFEFVMNNRDASNLIDILNCEKTRALQSAQKFLAGAPNITRVNRMNAAWYEGHAEYLEGIIQTILNGCVGEET